ncbi:aminotransferase class III-fold pyridoxal phosphate-dependent enzyme [Rhodococcus fascians]|nr:aminotransferase class III-fold pyridoxal phosphate-dependent enzyme [Rhodococcus fascians]MBY4239446.1 aminotransferase class III-fold pyridoxal phosphate-dependent enzyme [Rhodococcus fascians]MBY4254971.1 aminotransferase class III-fold pyridoxal phosphate-dependent enzyme [Rhodococcus fascians]MBY4270802.1 aminotransferase class III-fold pyridoxal phosphate-dependent enzyme [Rhodococcus fascians]
MIDMGTEAASDIERTARKALDLFGIGPDATITFVNYRENYVFRVQHPTGDWALKLHRAGYRTDNEIRSEAAVLAELSAAGLRVTVPVPAVDGGHLAWVNTDSGDVLQATLQRWLPGTSALGCSPNIYEGRERPSRQQFEELGTLMARMHSHFEKAGAPHGYERGAWDAVGLVGDRALWGRASDLGCLTPAQADVVRRAEMRLEVDLAHLPVNRRTFGPVHADLTVENVLTDDGGLVIIDFDDSGEGWYLFDIATTYFFCSNHPESEDVLQAIVDGYHRVRELTEEDLVGWHSLLLARALSYLAWSVDRPGDPASVFHERVMLPRILDAAEMYLTSGRTPWDQPTPTERHNSRRNTVTDRPLLERRYHTLGSNSPLFYDEPIEFVRASGVRITDANGIEYLDGYNNVPHVGHAHPAVVDAIGSQAATLNIHTRYLNNRVVDYAEDLLSTFDAPLDRIMFTNSGSESNDVAFRIADQRSGHRGVLISDWSYHGHTRALAEATTGLRAVEALGDHVRAIRIPDLDGHDVGQPEELVSNNALAEVDRAIESLVAAGHGVSLVLIDSLFSTEGLNRVPAGYVSGLAERVRRAGGLVIGDEVQSGFGRVGDKFWGYQMHGIVPDLVTMGKPMANGHPMGGVVLSHDLLDEFSTANMYFNTFGGNPVSAAAGHAVLKVLRDEGLVERAEQTGAFIRSVLEELRGGHSFMGPIKGRGLFFGFEVFDGPAGDPTSRPSAARTKHLVEEMKKRRVLISKIGRHDTVLKMRPPMAFTQEDAHVLLDALRDVLDSVGWA